MYELTYCSGTILITNCLTVNFKVTLTVTADSYFNIILCRALLLFVHCERLRMTNVVQIFTYLLMCVFIIWHFADVCFVCNSRTNIRLVTVLSHERAL